MGPNLGFKVRLDVTEPKKWINWRWKGGEAPLLCDYWSWPQGLFLEVKSPAIPLQVQKDKSNRVTLGGTLWACRNFFVRTNLLLLLRTYSAHMTSIWDSGNSKSKVGLRVAEEDDVGKLWSACTHSTRLPAFTWNNLGTKDHDEQEANCRVRICFFVQLDRSPPNF